VITVSKQMQRQGITALCSNSNNCRYRSTHSQGRMIVMSPSTTVPRAATVERRGAGESSIHG